MELVQLKTFRDIALSRSFTKAARVNFLTQPSVSARIKQLEQELSVRLFDRAPRKVLLTREGELILPRVEEILSQCESLKTFISETSGTLIGEIRVATIPSVGMYQLASALKQFMSLYPDIHLGLQYRNSSIIYDLVLNKKVALGLVAYPEKRAHLRITPFRSDELVIIVPAKHPLSTHKSISLRMIDRQPFVAFDEGIPTREAIDALLLREGVKVSVKMTNDNIYAIKKAVEAGIGISIVPDIAVQEEIRAGTLHALRIRKLRPQRPIGIITRNDLQINTPLKLFIDTLLDRSGKQKSGLEERCHYTGKDYSEQ